MLVHVVATEFRFRDTQNRCHGGCEVANLGTGENDRMRAMGRSEHDGVNAAG